MGKMMIIVLALCMAPVMAIMMIGTSKCNKGHFDEMQERIRGNAYKYSCISVGCFLGCYLLYSFITPDTFIRLSSEILAASSIALGIVVFDIYCVMKDAYYYFNEKTIVNGKRMIALFVIIFLLYSASFSLNIARGKELVQDGIVMFRNYCFTGILMLIVLSHLGALIAKRAIEKKAGESVDEKS
ncbi:MAG: hypothetical protein K5769_05195 [Pseudobutyrivibrio sp.]|nr:hypothetical protein [Pseudobutyrivibrio sp.]